METYTIKEKVVNKDTDIIADYLNSELQDIGYGECYINEYTSCWIGYSDYTDIGDGPLYAIHFCFITDEGEEYDVTFDLPEWSEDEVRDGIGVDIETFGSYSYVRDMWLLPGNKFYTKIYLICEKYMRGVI